MSGRTTIGLGSCSIALLALLLAGTASAASPPRTFEVRSVTVSVVKHDVSPKGPSKGDWSTTSDRLLNPTAQFGRPAGAVIGSDQGRATATSKTTYVVNGTVTLPGGTLILGGPVRPRPGGGAILQVTGGTGIFLHAHGTEALIGTGSKPINRFTLSYR